VVFPLPMLPAIPMCIFVTILRLDLRSYIKKFVNLKIRETIKQSILK